MQQNKGNLNFSKVTANLKLHGRNVSQNVKNKMDRTYSYDYLFEVKVTLGLPQSRALKSGPLHNPSILK